ncbi:MAG: hypothetical protein WCQ49_02095 [Candidatus Saccharibacteria bacterium]
MIIKNELSKIGIGTWGIGGFMEATNNDDENEKQIDSLIYSFDKEINYFETVYMYAQGKTIDLLARAPKEEKRPAKMQNFMMMSILMEYSMRAT